MDNNEEENRFKALEQIERQVTESQRGCEQTRTTKVGSSEERFQLAEKVTYLRGSSVKGDRSVLAQWVRCRWSISPVHEPLLYKEVDALFWTWIF